MERERYYGRVLLWIAVPLFIVMILLYLLHWYKLDRNIADIKEQNRKSFEKLAIHRGYMPSMIEVNSVSKKQVVVDVGEIERIKSYVLSLTEEVKRESNRAESIIDKDLDRLNLYMSVGIGFMTLLGIFVPILINVVSVQDLRDKQNRITESFRELTEQSPGIEKALAQSNAALEKSKGLEGMSQRIEAVETKAGKVIPDVYNLILQNAIARFFNISPILLSNAVRDDDYGHFIKLLQVIRASLLLCKNADEHIAWNNDQFFNTITDFMLFLNTEKFRLQSVINTRQEVNEFDSLLSTLNDLRNSTPENEDSNYHNVIEGIDAIIAIFKNKGANKKAPYLSS